MLNATSPNAIAAPTAKPSPKLCKPMPIAIIKDIANPFDSLENSERLIRIFPIPYSPKNDNMTTVAINNSPLKTDARCVFDISNASSIASNPKNNSNPIVNAKKKLNAFLPNFFINGYHSKPIIIGTTPISNPIIPRNTNNSEFGSNEAEAASICFSNLVPSSIVRPTVYG